MGLIAGSPRSGEVPSGLELLDRIKTNIQNWEELGLTDLLIPQRWWGTGEEIEGSSFDCLAMTTFLGATQKHSTSSRRFIQDSLARQPLRSGVPRWTD